MAMDKGSIGFENAHAEPSSLWPSSSGLLIFLPDGTEAAKAANYDSNTSAFIP
jgi:hypothetical protein